MNIHREPVLDEREFGRAAVRVDLLCAWAKDAGAMLPPTVPLLQDFEAMQLESLLVAMQRGVQSMSDKNVLAAAIGLLNDASVPETHPKERASIVDEADAHAARWFVGAEIHRQWRARLEDAIAAGKLNTFDAQTGLPMNTPPTGSIPAGKAVQHSTKTTRRDAVDVFLDAALAAVHPAIDIASVWAELQRMEAADRRPGTFICVDEDGAKHTDDNGVVAWITKRNLGKRIRNRGGP